MATYAEKLKDPRWQKKRLEILERDDWKCKRCGESEKTLHVHHDFYDENPWDTQNCFLQTMCEKCHKREHKWKDFYDKIGEEKTDQLVTAVHDIGFDIVWEYAALIMREALEDREGRNG